MPARTVTARRLVTIGWVLYFVSLITPDPGLTGVGATWFVLAPVYGYSFIHQDPSQSGYDWRTAIMGGTLLLGLAANILLFLKSRAKLLVVTAVLPWLPFVAYWDLWRRHDVIAPPWSLLYFFPWAIGIGLICASKHYLLREGAT